jgi:hypothetical protein
VAVVHGLVVVLTLVALACLPCLLAAVVLADVALETISRTIRRAYRRRHERWAGRRLARRAGLKEPEVARPAGPPIEQIAADLRRLGKQRIGVAAHSPIWFAAVQRAYDDRLSMACLELEIPQHLGELTGLDQEIERVRIEGELTAAGILLAAADTDRHQDHR